MELHFLLAHDLVNFDGVVGGKSGLVLHVLGVEAGELFVGHCGLLLHYALSHLHVLLVDSEGLSLPLALV